MFFTKITRIIALVGFVFGFITVGFATETAIGFLDGTALAHYTDKPPEQVILWGIYTILIALALGTLAEISLSASKPLDE